MKPLALLPAVALLVAGCVTQRETRWTWHRPGGGAVVLQQQLRDCRAEAYATPGVSQMQADLLRDRCMTGLGWQKVEADQDGCALVKGSDGQSRPVCH